MRDYARANPSKWNNPTEIHKRTERNKARHDFAEKMGVSPKSLNGDVDHKKPLRSGGKTVLSNLRLVSEKVNRGWKRGSK